MQLREILGNLTQLNATICGLVKVNAIYGSWVLNRIKSPTTRRQDVCCGPTSVACPPPLSLFAFGSTDTLLSEAIGHYRDLQYEASPKGSSEKAPDFELPTPVGRVLPDLKFSSLVFSDDPQ